MALSSRIPALPVFFLLILFPSVISGQENKLTGIVTDTSGIAIPGVTIRILSGEKGTISASDGTFSLPFLKQEEVQALVFSCVGYRSDTLRNINSNHAGLLKVILHSATIGIKDVRVTATRNDNVTIVKIPVVAGAVIPSIAGGIESAIASLPGVASFSELSSSYSVRGGSYDENLVYINDVEIYKPYLVRAGQQEGLSRINPDLTASVNFSPGGFSASYGDRMSSVLDIRYREPEGKESSLSLSLLTSSAHAGTRSADKKFWIIAGARYRSNALLLSSFDTKGEYSPTFADIQSFAGYKTGDNSVLTLSVWGSLNRYAFIPESRTTTFGTVDNSYKLYAYFEGAERDRYDNAGGALTFDIQNTDRISSKFILSGYMANENERFDIRGAYSLSSLDKTEGSENNPDTLLNAGTGSWLTHARNTLQTYMMGLSYRGSVKEGSNGTDWGMTVRYRRHQIGINEWLRVDSAGYTTEGEDEGLTLASYDDRSIITGSMITEGWLINRRSFTVAGKKTDLNAGIRASFDTYNSELLVSPRLSVTMAMSGNLSVYVATGAYHQPPGGREMMLEDYDFTTPLKAQRSYHLTAGARYDFIAWDRPFRLTAEAYGKIFNRLIPYSVDNVRLIYYGGNIAEGYSAGLDLRVNGEFVRGAESWFSLSFMKSEINIPSYNSGWFPAPFDQRVTFNIFFQDYLPGHPDFKVNINLAFGTGIPASPPGRDQWDIWFRMPPYRRIDIGFSKVLLSSSTSKKPCFMKEFIAGFEIYNLADIRNTISYTWIETVRNSAGEIREYAVPNYLTRRSLNLKLTALF